MKFSRPFAAHAVSEDEEPVVVAHAALLEGGYLDGSGWPERIPDGADDIRTLWNWTWFPGAEQEAQRVGEYVLEWEGAGDLELFGDATILSSEPGRITFRNESGETIGLRITATDPEFTGDNIRDITLMRTEHTALYEAGAIFNPDWIALIEDARELRFMTWMETTDSTVRSWADRTDVEAASYVGGFGVPLEIMVRLANETGTDPWFSLPHGANEGYIRNFAEYVATHLDPGLVPTYELSNEIWNFLFAQTSDYAAAAEAEWGLTWKDKFPDYHSMYGKKAVEMAQVLDGVYAGTGLDYKKTLAVQARVPEYAELKLTAPSWAAADPDGYIAPHTLFDSIAVTTYFGSDILRQESGRAALQAAIDDPDVDAQVWLYDLLQDPSYRWSVPDVGEDLQFLHDLGESYGLDMVAYEGGQHVHHLFGIDADAAQFRGFMTDFVRSDYMRDLYQQLWDIWADLGDGPFMQFVDVEPASGFGSWGLYDNLGDSTSRSDLLETLNATTPVWWESRGGEHFQQGALEGGTAADEALTGTDLGDFLSGGAGDDTVSGGDGADGLHGGTGDDTVLGGEGDDRLLGGAGENRLEGGPGEDTAAFAGRRDEYAISKNGGGVTVVTGRGERSEISTVETLAFADQSLDAATLERRDMSTGTGRGLDDPTLSFNVAEFVPRGAEMPFLNVVKQSTGWTGRRPGEWQAMDEAALEAGGYLDANGYLTALPDDITSVGTMIDWYNSINDPLLAASRTGTYVATWEGEGDLRVLDAASIVSQSDNRIVFTNDGGSFRVEIFDTDPNGTGDYIRDVAVVRAEYQDLYEAGAMFNPDWTALIEDARELRFMKWMKTNSDPNSDWSERNSAEDMRWTDKSGVPVEVMVRLANELGIDPWFNIPIDADETYIRNFAEYVRDNLNPGLRASIEIGNENWNGVFSQTQWLASEMEANWGETVTPGWQAAPYHAKVATENALIWDDVFQGQEERIQKILGGWTFGNFITETLLNADLWKEKEPDAWVRPADVFDAMAFTSFFGSPVAARDDYRFELQEKIAELGDDGAMQWLTDRMLTDPDYFLSIPSVQGLWAAQKGILDGYGLKMILTEGGQHLHHSFNAAGALAVGDFMADYVRSPYMSQLYEASWAAWEAVGDGPYMQFVDVETSTLYGSFGLYKALGDTTPRAETLNDLNGSAPAWWEDRAGTHFQQGLMEAGSANADTIIGTAKADFLAGNAGHDTLNGLDGNDAIHGGEGNDMLLGGNGHDRLFASSGFDMMTGGSGQDEFVFVDAMEDGDAAATFIVDYTAGADAIDLGGAGPTRVLETFSMTAVLAGDDGDVIYLAGTSSDDLTFL